MGIQIREVDCIGGSACIINDEPTSVRDCYLGPCKIDPLTTWNKTNHNEEIGLEDGLQPDIFFGKNTSNSGISNSLSDFDYDGSAEIESSNIRSEPLYNVTYSNNSMPNITKIKTFNLSSHPNLEYDIISPNNTFNNSLESNSTVSPQTEEYVLIPDDFYEDFDVSTSSPKQKNKIIVSGADAKNVSVSEIQNSSSNNALEEETKTRIQNFSSYNEPISGPTTISTANATIVHNKTNDAVNDRTLNETLVAANSTKYIVTLNSQQIVNEKPNLDVENAKNEGKIENDPTSVERNEINYNYYGEDEYEYLDYYEELNSSISPEKTAIERPEGIVEDKINIDDVQVIEIVKRKGKKSKNKGKIKKVKMHTGVKAMKVLKKFSKKANKKKYLDNYILKVNNKTSPIILAFF